MNVILYTEHCPYCDSEDIIMIGDAEYNDWYLCELCNNQFGKFITKEGII